MDLFTSPLENEEMSLRQLAMPSMEDIEMQKSDLALATTHYEVKPGIIKLRRKNHLEDRRMTTHIDTLRNSR
jgi:hypothetical protein